MPDPVAVSMPTVKVPEPVPVILICPCCATALDTYASATEFECAHCGQIWSMEVDLERQQASSI